MRSSARIPVLPVAAPFALLISCASPPATVSAPPPQPIASASASSSAPIDEPPPVVTASASAPPPAPVIPVVDLGSFTHELDEPVVSLSLGKPHVGALGVDPWMLSGGTWKKIPFPEKMRSADGQPYDARIFFGRDDLPRVMGTRPRDGQAAQLYFRYRNFLWIEEKKEVAKLLDPPAKPLWGVLGDDDPEVACKLDDTCIVKRRTGWKTIPSGPGTPRVDLQSGVPWAMYPDHMARLDKDKTWVTVGSQAPFHDPAGFCVVGDEIWVSEPGTDKIHHLRAGTWTTEASPMSSPRGMWATSRTDVWLAGATGLAHHDGQTWSRVSGPTGPLAEVQGRGAEIWAAGKSGVWSRKKP